MTRINKTLFIMLIFTIQFWLISCVKQNNNDALNEINPKSNYKGNLVDPTTPEDVQPNIITPGKNTIPASETKYHVWELVFSDEFNNTEIDFAKWNNDLYDRGWRGGIKTWHKPENISENGNALVIRYKKDAAVNYYSSGRLDTKNKFEMAYGYWECSMRIAYPNGYQTAFWMMPNAGTAPDSVYDGTAHDGCEIDIIEGNRQGNIYSNGLHWDGYGTQHKASGQEVSAPFIHNGQNHIYGLEWSPTFMKFYYDGVLKRTITDPKLISHVKEYAILSGGIFATDWTDGNLFTAPLPDYAYVDYMRVYKSRQMNYGTGYFKINNNFSKKSMTVGSGQTTNGIRVIHSPDNELNHQLCKINHLGSGLYNIICKHSNKCIGQIPSGYLAQ
jgi:beta-glucanase (GH16 family)